MGYGDLYPETQRGRLYAIFFIPIGIGMLLQTVAMISTIRFSHRYANLEKIGDLLREDIEKHGVVTYSDFQMLLLTRLQAKPEPYILKLLAKQFKAIDYTGDGILTAADLDPGNIASLQESRIKVVAPPERKLPHIQQQMRPASPRPSSGGMRRNVPSAGLSRGLPKGDGIPEDLALSHKGPQDPMSRVLV